MTRIVIKGVFVATLSGGLIGCANKTQTGALAGGAGGAAVGGLIGSMSHANAGKGALIGGAVGALGGAVIGHAADKEDDRRERDRRIYEEQRERSYYQSSSYGYASQPRPAMAARTLTRDDIILWSQRGTRDEIIIDRIEQSGARFYVSAADENQLRDAGVSPEVIRAMKETARR